MPAQIKIPRNYKKLSLLINSEKKYVGVINSIDFK